MSDTPPTPPPSSQWPATDWRRTLISELANRRVPPQRIGETLAEVDSHCADSAQHPGDAFGHPRDYADSLTVGATHHGVDWRRLAPMAATIAGLFGYLLATRGAAGLRGGPATFPIFAVVYLGYTAVVVLTALVLMQTVLRHVRPEVMGWIILGLALPPILPMVFLIDGDAFSGPPWLFLVAGTVSWSAIFWYWPGLVPLRGVIDPRTGQEDTDARRMTRARIWMYAVLLSTVLIQAL